MHAEHRLALALGGLDARTVTGDTEETRKQLVRAGEAMVDAGLAIVLNKAGTKQPLCTLNAREAKTANQAAQDAAAVAGDPKSHARKHTCGLNHVITERRDATRILTRVARGERFNIGVHCGLSRVLVIDLDTARQLAEFLLRCGKQRPSLTVRSPGSRDAAGNWAHKDGGHVWFEVPPDVELPINTGIYKDPAGWVAMWGEHQVLVPPSVRPEGPYDLVGSTHPLPEWLLDTVTLASREVEERRAESRRRREERRARGGTDEIDEWSTRTSWSEILEPDGWVETTLIDRCGCPIWTAPGAHASLKSATAHEVGCDTYSCEVGHGPLHVWTDNPSEAVEAAVRAYGKRTLTKIQVVTWTQGAGNMGRTCDELGIERPGPTVISRPLAKWEGTDETDPPVETTRPEPPASTPPDLTVADDIDDDDEFVLHDEDDGPASIDEINEHSPRKVEEISYDEQMIRREFQRLYWQEAARQRYEAAEAPQLRLLDSDEFFETPDPEQIVPGLFYVDSLSRIVGAPGCGKSFLAIAVALTVALGRRWCGEPVKRGPVIYIMAEGQRVNKQRAQAWLEANHLSRDVLKGWFYSVPDAVMLTPEGVQQLAEKCREVRPALVIFDTKNAMMVGEENSGTDSAEMRRALDVVRKSCDACCVLVDHTGKAGGDDGRGSNAVKAAMDTQILVENDGGKPAIITATVVRDKAAEAGRAWEFFLEPHHPAAVLKYTSAAEQEERAKRSEPAWKTAEGVAVPTDLLHYKGAGEQVMPFLARFLAHDASPRHGDPNGVGVSRAEATRAMRHEGFEETSVRRAWSALIVGGYIERAEGCKADTGRHVWTR